MAAKKIVSWLATRIIAPIIVLVVGAVIVKSVIDDGAPQGRPGDVAASSPSRDPSGTPAAPTGRSETEAINDILQRTVRTDPASDGERRLPSARAATPGMTTVVAGLGPIEWDGAISDAFDFRAADVHCRYASMEVQLQVVAKTALPEGSPVTTGQALIYDDQNILLDQGTVFINKDQRYQGRPGWQQNMSGTANVHLIGARCAGLSGARGYTIADVARVVVRPF